jgi:hypothetical protein
MVDPDFRVLLREEIERSAEGLYEVVAGIADPVVRARAALHVVDLIQGDLLPDMVSIRRAAVGQARRSMSVQELADRLRISRAQVYAVLAGGHDMVGPLSIRYRTADGGVGEARVAWIVEPLRGARRVRVTREEIRRRLPTPAVTVVVPADSVEVTPTPDNARLDAAFRSLENQAAYALSQADLAAQAILERRPGPVQNGAGWHFRADGESSPRWPRTRYVELRSWWGLQER